MSSLSAVTLICLAACAASRATTAPAEKLTAPEPVAPPAPPPPPEKTLCWTKGKPKPIELATAPTKTGCRSFNEALLLRAEARIRKDTPITFRPSRLYVDVLCDPTTAKLRDLVYEDGDATKGTLRIVHVSELDGGEWSVRVIESVHARGQRRVEMKGGTFKELRTPVDAARISLHVQPNLVAIANGQPGSGTDGAAISRVYQRVTVEDIEGHVVDRMYLGPPSVASLHDRLPIIGAIDAIDTALAKPKTKLVAIEETEDDRAMYLRRLALAMALPSEDAWVTERYLNLATTFATVEAIPLLVSLLAAPSSPQADTLRESALDAIAAITGWNPRVAPDGKERTTAEAAAIAVDECATSPSPST